VDPRCDRFGGGGATPAAPGAPPRSARVLAGAPRRDPVALRGWRSFGVGVMAGATTGSSCGFALFGALPLGL
jgi:hypothetical protein